MLGGPEGFDFIDPALAYSTGSFPFVAMIGDGLTAVQRAAGRDGTQIVPDLAVTLPRPQDGGRTYRFVLRSGIHYSTGGVVRARDVRPSFERLWKIRPFEKASSSGPGFFADIVGAARCTREPRTCDLSHGIVTDPGDDSVVTFHLTRPDPEFLHKLALRLRLHPARRGRRRARPTSGPYRPPARTWWPATDATTCSCWSATRTFASGRRPLSQTAIPIGSNCASTSRFPPSRCRPARAGRRRGRPARRHRATNGA